MTSISAANLPQPNRELFRQLVSFAAIGAASTLAYVALYAFIRQGAPSAVANAAALVITAVANTAANRRLTFAVRNRSGLARDHGAGLIALVVALAITSAALAALPIVAPHHGRLSELAVLVSANAVATLVRFLLLRAAIDRTDAGRQSTETRLTTVRLLAAQRFATLCQSKRTRG